MNQTKNELKQMIEAQKNFNQKVKETKAKIAELLAIYQNGNSGYEYEVEVETALKQAYFAMEKI